MSAQSISATSESRVLPAGFEVEVFFDGDCPLCKREVGFLRRKDKQQRICFTDIADPAFVADEYGLQELDFMNEIQGRMADGTWLSGVEVFRRLYSAIGFGPIVWLTRLPVISQLLDFGYRIFARYRLTLTGRSCHQDGCQLPASTPSAADTPASS